MLQDLLIAALGRSGSLGNALKDELARLKERGYLGDDADAVASELLGQLEGRAAQAQSTVTPMLRTVGGALREALDIPSRSEIVALTEALKRAEAARAAGEPGSESTEPPSSSED